MKLNVVVINQPREIYFLILYRNIVWNHIIVIYRIVSKQLPADIKIKSENIETSFFSHKGLKALANKTSINLMIFILIFAESVSVRFSFCSRASLLWMLSSLLEELFHENFERKDWRWYVIKGYIYPPPPWSL